MKQRLASIGRVLLLLAGLGVVAYLVHRAGPDKVGAILKDAWVFLPITMGCEIVYVMCDVMCVRAQLGTHSKNITLRSWIWSSTYAYALQILFPAGRAAGEVARISVLQKHVAVPRLAVASIGYQASNLYAVATLSLVDAALSYFLADALARGLALGEAINFLVVGGIATSLTIALHSKRATDFIAKRFKLSDAHREELADATRSSLTVKRGALFCTMGRFVQLFQYGIFVLAIGGKSGIVQASLAHGTQLVGASLGDLIPGQVGAVEGAYTAFADAIHLTPDRVLALPLFVRMTQISLALTSLIVATVMGRKTTTDNGVPR